MLTDKVLTGTMEEKNLEKIPYDEANPGRKLMKLNYEKKHFLDCIKIYS